MRRTSFMRVWGNGEEARWAKMFLFPAQTPPRRLSWQCRHHFGSPASAVVRMSEMQKFASLIRPSQSLRLATRPPLSSQRAASSAIQKRLPAAYYRGGTSRAVIFNRKDLPADKKEWPKIFRRVIGSPGMFGCTFLSELWRGH